MRWLSSFSVCAALLATPSLAASGIFGVWATQKNNGRVLVESCGVQVCGRVIDGDQLRANPNQTDSHNPVPDKRARRVKGLIILEGYNGGPVRWSGGSVYDPQTGDESGNSTLTLISRDSLEVEGCRVIFCRSEVWTRVE